MGRIHTQTAIGGPARPGRASIEHGNVFMAGLTTVLAQCLRGINYMAERASVGGNPWGISREIPVGIPTRSASLFGV